MYNYLNLILLCLISIHLPGQCPTGSAILVTQAEVDQFILDYPNCTNINGSLWIGGNSPSDITDLSGLANIQTVSNGLLIRYCPLTNLLDLSMLQSVTDVSIYECHQLVDLQGLENLGPNLTDLSISDCSSLTSLTGFEGIHDITGYDGLDIRNNDNLVSLQGLDNLLTTQYLVVSNNVSLVSLDGLDNLTSVERQLNILDNDSLNDLSGLSSLVNVASSYPQSFSFINNDNLTSLAGIPFSNLNTNYNLSISHNDGIVDLSGLEGITQIGFLSINNNDNLTSLSGLDNLISAERVRIWDNNALIDLSGLGSLETTANEIDIKSNLNLTSLEGLNSIITTGGFAISGNNSLITTQLSKSFESGGVFVLGNSMLTDINGLDSLIFDLTDFFYFSDNTQLSICEIESVCNHIENGGNAFFNNNTDGCNSLSEVENACSSVLPVNYSQELQAVREISYVELSFSTAQQINNSHFEIMHSSDGRSFQTIGNIEGEGTTTEETNYEHTHHTPAIGVNYYRVKQVDYDGKYGYSNIAAVQYDNGLVGIYPNPASNRLTISTSSKLGYVVRQVNGSIILKGNTDRDTEVDISNIDRGVYFIHFDNGYVERFLKM